MAVKQTLTKLTYMAAALGGGLSTYCLLRERKVAYMSWTTNHNPSTIWDWNWDKRDPSTLAKPIRNGKINDANLNNNIEESEKALKSCSTRHLIFIRHGQYNLEGVTDKDRTLTPFGCEQAKLTGKRLVSLSYPYTKLIYSTMTRATETANIIIGELGDIEVKQCDLLQEGAPIPPEPPIGSWRKEMHKFFTDGARIEAAFRKYFHRAPPSQTEDTYEIYVCHSNVIRYFICRALQIPPEAWLRFSLHNGSMTHVTIRPDGRVGIKSLGESGFMPPKMLSFN